MRTMSELIKSPQAEAITEKGWALPENLSKEQWIEIGVEFSKVDQAINWAWGDWWNAGNWEHGERKALVESEGWTGPSYKTLRMYGGVCNTFQMSSRLDISFAHHQECVSLPLEEAIQVLEWAIENKASRRATRQKVKEMKNPKTEDGIEDAVVVEDDPIYSSSPVKLKKCEQKVFDYVSSQENKVATSKEAVSELDDIKKMDVTRSLSDLVNYGKLEERGKDGKYKIYGVPIQTIHEKPLRERFEAVDSGEVVHLTPEEYITDEFKELWEEFGFNERSRLHVVTRDKSPFFNPYYEHEKSHENYKCWRHWIDNKPSVVREIAEIKKTFVLSKHNDFRFVKYAVDKSRQ